MRTSSNLRSFAQAAVRLLSSMFDLGSLLYTNTRPMMRGLFRDGIRSINSVLNADVNKARLCTSGSCLVLANENDEGEKQNTLPSLEQDYVNGSKEMLPAVFSNEMRGGHRIRFESTLNLKRKNASERDDSSNELLMLGLLTLLPGVGWARW